MTVIDTIAEAEAKALNDKLAGLDLAGRLSLVAGLGGRVVFTTSLGIEDQVISAEILAFIEALDTREIHGYRPELGFRVFADEALLATATVTPISPAAEAATVRAA